jgi:signal transduction histidine kinase
MNQRTFTVRREPLDLGSLAVETGRRYEPRARGFGVSLSIEAEPGARALGDPDRVLQVVSNLVENALRCTPAGGAVTVAASPGTLAVTDTGPGLAPEDAARAFERFYLYGRYGGQRPVGTGLGLALVKELSEAMGGSVAVRSTVGTGTSFTVRLPIDQVPEASAEAATQPTPASQP